MELDGRLRYQEFRGHKLSRLYYDYQALPCRTVIFEEENTGMFDWIPAVVDELRYSGFSIYQHVEEGADGRVHHYTLIKEDIESPTPLNGMTYRIIRDGKPWILIEDGEQGRLVRQDIYYPSF